MKIIDDSEVIVAGHWVEYENPINYRRFSDYR